MSKIVTVVGATGQQGKGVIAAFAGNPDYHIRGLTRKPDSTAAQSLTAQGVEVVKADLDDLDSLKAAFAGSHIIFAVTDFYEPFQKHGPARAKEVEFEQGTNMAKAAAATPTLEHYIWSTLPNGHKDFPVPHFESKFQVDEFIRQDAVLLAKTTFLIICFYGNNLALPSFRPYWIETAKKYIQFTTYPTDTPMQFIGDVTVNITPFIKSIVDKSDETRGGAIVVGSIGSVTAEEWVKAWAEPRGFNVELVQIPRAQYDALWPWPLWSEEFALMMEFFERNPLQNWLNPEHKVLTAESLRVSGLEGLKEWGSKYELPAL